MTSRVSESSRASAEPSRRDRSAVLVLGDGGWGTALALTLSGAGHDVRLWGYDDEYCREMSRTRRNPRFLPDVELPEELTISGRIETLGEGVEVILSVVPTQFLRGALERIGASLPSALVVSASKGIEKGTLALPSGILRQELPTHRVAVLSGPSHAEEVSRRLPTTVAVASEDEDDALRIQALFATTRLRVYTNDDCIGVELGGAVKNVIAIAAGISDGLGFGDNSRAAIVTRGLVEMTRLGAAMGARRETFSGLSGLGDLITTCTSEHSRNRRVGFRIGRGERLADIVSSTRMVAEGVETTRSVRELARKLDVELPITDEVFAVLYESKAPLEAVESLMSRDLKGELAG